MERDCRKDEDGKSDNSDTYSHGTLERIGSQPTRDNEEGQAILSNPEDLIPLMQRIQTQRFLNLGIPGGYEQYNYKDARMISQKYVEIQKELKKKMATGLQSMIKSGKGGMDHAARQRELDDIFYVSDDSDAGTVERD